MALDPEAVLARFYAPGSPTLALLIRHGRQVAAKALAAADQVFQLAPDRAFIYEAAMLHDVGIFKTDSPFLGCHGPVPYVCHGVLGRRLLERIGLHRHGLVCERHVGVGLSAADIRTQKLPLPARDMQPVSIEEQLICYADKFFSKIDRRSQSGRTLTEVIARLARYGAAPVARFRGWADIFEAH